MKKTFYFDSGLEDMESEKEYNSLMWMLKQSKLRNYAKNKLISYGLGDNIAGIDTI